jgi:hypothetical protein
MISGYIWTGRAEEQRSRPNAPDMAHNKDSKRGSLLLLLPPSPQTCAPTHRVLPLLVALGHFMSTETCSKLITRYFHLVGDAYLQNLLSSALTDIGKRRKKAKNGGGVSEVAKDARMILERIVGSAMPP